MRNDYTTSTVDGARGFAERNCEQEYEETLHDHIYDDCDYEEEGEE